MPHSFTGNVLTIGVARIFEVTITNRTVIATQFEASLFETVEYTFHFNNDTYRRERPMQVESFANDFGGGEPRLLRRCAGSRAKGAS